MSPFIRVFVCVIQLQGILKKNSIRLTAVILFNIEDKELVKRITGRLVCFLLATHMHTG
jgi:adenylate kinase family enzyme